MSDRDSIQQEWKEQIKKLFHPQGPGHAQDMRIAIQDLGGIGQKKKIAQEFIQIKRLCTEMRIQDRNIKCYEEYKKQDKIIKWPYAQCPISIKLFQIDSRAGPEHMGNEKSANDKKQGNGRLGTSLESLLSENRQSSLLQSDTKMSGKHQQCSKESKSIEVFDPFIHVLNYRILTLGSTMP